MPLPWKKKMKITTTISQFVNDHLRKSQRRRDGSSLVVETGFPTSLVDLFIKNREKLKKSSKIKHQFPPIPPVVNAVNDPSDSPLPSPLITVSPLIKMSSLPSECVDENIAVGSSECVCERRGVDANMVMLVVLKMFLVVVLALATKKLTIGITLSAFLLFLMDYIGEHLLKHSVVTSVWRMLGFKVVKFDEEKSDGVLLVPKPDCCRNEIEIVESNRYVDEIEPENETMDVRGRSECRIQEVESKEETVCAVSELKRKSRREKIKSKMKKLVPKKLRSCRKEQDRKGLEITKDEQQEVVRSEYEYESECTSELSSISSRRYKDDDEISVVCASKIEEKTEEIQNGQTWRYLVICLIIVLVGLVGGRAFALLLTLSWCLLLKLGEKYPSYMKVSSMIKKSN